MRLLYGGGGVSVVGWGYEISCVLGREGGGVVGIWVSIVLT
jgi:hypothetical protein